MRIQVTFKQLNGYKKWSTTVVPDLCTSGCGLRGQGDPRRPSAVKTDVYRPVDIDHHYVTY